MFVIRSIISIILYYLPTVLNHLSNNQDKLGVYVLNLLPISIFTSFEHSLVSALKSPVQMDQTHNSCLIFSFQRNPNALSPATLSPEITWMNQSTFAIDRNLSIPSRVVKRHKTLYLHFFISSSPKSSLSYYYFEPYAYEMIEFTRMLEPEPDQYLLLSSSANQSNQSSTAHASHLPESISSTGLNRSAVPETLHVLSTVSVQLMLQNSSLTKMEIPPEVFELIRFRDQSSYLPLLWIDRMALEARTLPAPALLRLRRWRAAGGGRVPRATRVARNDASLDPLPALVRFASKSRLHGEGRG